MKFAALPNAGGIYDQHPKLIERWEIIFLEKNKKDADDHEKSKIKSGQKAPAP